MTSSAAHDRLHTSDQPFVTDGLAGVFRRQSSVHTAH